MQPPDWYPGLPERLPPSKMGPTRWGLPGAASSFLRFLEIHKLQHVSKSCTKLRNMLEFWGKDSNHFGVRLELSRSFDHTPKFIVTYDGGLLKTCTHVCICLRSIRKRRTLPQFLMRYLSFSAPLILLGIDFGGKFASCWSLAGHIGSLWINLGCTVPSFWVAGESF